MKSRFLILPVLFALASVPSAAEDGLPGPLHVLRPILHSAQENAELCLEFDRALGGIGTNAHIANLLHLESDGKTVATPAKTISVGDNQICLSNLLHRRDYKLTLAPFSTTKGEKLAEAYTLSFTIPARTPSLAFINAEWKNGITVWRDNLRLRSVNSDKVMLELYRITDPAKMADAWTQRLQTTLAPSESLYVARQNGELMWKQNIVPESIPDHYIESSIDFFQQRTAEFPPGFYLLGASLEEPTRTAGAKKANPLAAVAAAWLIRSDMDVQAFKDGKNYTAVVDTHAAPAEGIRVLLLDRDEHIIAEGRSDTHGITRLTPNAEQGGEPQTLLALRDDGAVAFLDLPRVAQNPALPPLTATLAADQTLYAPKDTVNIALSVRDLHKRPLQVIGSNLILMRPDRSLYENWPVNLDAAGNAKLSFTAPVANGIWYLAWKQADGSEIAKARIRISANPAAPELSTSSDHAALQEDGDIALTIRSRANNGHPAPYITGHIDYVWLKPQHPLAAWKDFTFDDGSIADPTPRTAGYFVTDDHGIARFHTTLPMSEASSRKQLQLRVVSNPAFAALDPEPLLLPVKVPGMAIGIKPSASKGHFAENSLAHFDIVAVDSTGHARPVDDLTYQIFEEGRSFEWLQSDGHWDYKPQQQQRRIGGGSLVFDEGGFAALAWPVTSGAYRLDIANADGILLAQKHFNAGWGFAEKEADDAATLNLKASPAHLQSGQEETITFTLAHPALVTAVIADDHIRQIQHAAYPAGVQTLTFTPAADWGDRLSVQAEARIIGDDHAGMEAGQILLSPDEPADAFQHASIKPVIPPKTYVADMPDMTLRVMMLQELAPQQSASIAASKTHGTDFVFAAARPLYNTPQILPSALRQHPITTIDVARHLLMLHLWHDVVITANLMSEAGFRTMSDDLLLRLLARQQSDGGFAPLAAATDSDLQSTISAAETLTALATVPRVVLDQTAAWLGHRLDNTWVQDGERPLRASTYAALAMLGKLDAGSLHYFSDTSAEKPMTQIASAAMAYAFTSINDRPAANFWLDKIANKGTNNISADALPLLLANNFFTPETADVALGNAGEKASNDAKTADEFLIALMRVQNRAGAWHVGFGKDEKTAHGILVQPVAEKIPLTLRNMSANQPLYVATANVARLAPEKNNLRRRIYNLDGSEHGAVLTRGEVYVVTVEGKWPEAGTIALHENPYPALQPLTCALATPSVDAFLGWLAGLKPNIAADCETTASGLDVLLKHSGQESDTWRIAYLARAKGSNARGAAPASWRINPDDKDALH